MIRHLPRSVPAVAILALGAVLAFAAPATAGFLLLGDSFDEVVEQQTVSMESAYFGGQAFLDPGRTSVSGSLFIGGDDIFDAGSSISVQTSHPPLEFGLSYAEMDAEFETWQIALNAQRQIVSGRAGTLMIQAAVAYQQMKDSERGANAVYIGGPNLTEFDDHPLVLMQKFSWTHFMTQAQMRFNAWRFHPILVMGFKVSDFEMSGVEQLGGGVMAGEKYETDGTRWAGHFGAGLELDLTYARPFVGVLRFDRGDIGMLGSVSVVF